MINLRHGLRGKSKPEPRSWAQPVTGAPSLFQPQQALGAQGDVQKPCGECAKRKAVGLPCCGRGKG